MKTINKLDNYSEMISKVKYDNEHGGQYAYMQMLAYSREILTLLRSVKNSERQAEAIESISWLLNEYLGSKFSPRHRAIFENKLSEMKQILSSVRILVNNPHLYRAEAEKVLHAVAA